MQYSPFITNVRCVALLAAMLVLCLLAVIQSANAQQRSDYNPLIALGCEITPNIGMDYLPISVPDTSNNLRRKEGAGIVADGEYVEIYGKVLDRFCVPVSNALVYLWQTDKRGHYLQYYTPQSDWDIREEKADPNFAYSGTARTNNRGEFYFVTIFPGGYDQRAPHLNVRVQHRDFEMIETQLFFKHHPRNKRDDELKKLSASKRERLTLTGRPLDPDYRIDGRQYQINITLDGQNRFQRY